MTVRAAMDSLTRGCFGSSVGGPLQSERASCTHGVISGHLGRAWCAGVRACLRISLILATIPAVRQTR